MPVHDRRNDPVSEMRRPFAIRLASDLPGLRAIVAVVQRLVESFRRKTRQVEVVVGLTGRYINARERPVYTSEVYSSQPIGLLGRSKTSEVLARVLEEQKRGAWAAPLS